MANKSGCTEDAPLSDLVDYWLCSRYLVYNVGGKNDARVDCPGLVGGIKGWGDHRIQNRPLKSYTSPYTTVSATS